MNKAIIFLEKGNVKMKIRIIKSNPAEGQDHINYLIDKEFTTIPYKEFDKEIREEMKELREVAIRTEEGQYILNKDEYEVIE